MTKKITVKIDKLGNPTIETEGYIGAECKEATKNIEELFAGGGGVSTEYKEEWSQVDSNQEAQTEKVTW